MKAIHDAMLINEIVCGKYYMARIKIESSELTYTIKGVLLFTGTTFHFITDEGMVIIRSSEIVELAPMVLPDEDEINCMTPKFGELLTRLKEEKFQKIRK